MEISRFKESLTSFKPEKERLPFWRTRVWASVVSNSNRSYLQDAVITMRDGRYCLPVKAEHKGQVSGMVHDQDPGLGIRGLGLGAADLVDIHGREEIMAQLFSKRGGGVLLQLGNDCRRGQSLRAARGVGTSR